LIYTESLKEIAADRTEVSAQREFVHYTENQLPDLISSDLIWKLYIVLFVTLTGGSRYDWYGYRRHFIYETRL